jgi:hypothetical protein
MRRETAEDRLFKSFLCKRKEGINLAIKTSSIATQKRINQILCFVMCESCHIRNVLIGVEYRNCRQTLDADLIFAIWMGQIQSKLICNLWTGQFVTVSYKSVI